MAHTPVLLEETIRYLDPKPNQNFIDATIGNGGHTEELLKRIGPEGKILGIDWNNETIMRLQKKFKREIEKGNLKLACDNFANLKNCARELHFEKISGITFDLGLSSEELEESGLGFSFRKDEPLFMTYSESRGRRGLNAAQVVNTFSGHQLEGIFQKYGEERFARRAARAIVEYRRKKRILTSRELADLIRGALPAGYERGRIHPATRIFQALRIYVNDELGNLETALVDALEIVGREGRVVVITYHSLEDRIAKDIFRQFSRSGKGELLTRKPVLPTPEEIKRNPRSRSAKLRAIRKIANKHE